MILFGVALSVLNILTARRDLALATGPESPAQRAWLVDAADRPDITTFYKKLSSASKVAMARAIGRYDDASLAKLAGKLLADFDADARRELTKSLTHIATVHPEAVADELKEKGSFQTLGVSAALRPQGARALPMVVKMLDNDDARPTAVSFLVQAGQASVPFLISALDMTKKEARLAAADALGKIRAREAVAPLLANFQAAPDDERIPFLAAVAAIGDPSTRSLMETTLHDDGLPPAMRAQAAFGLGRIGGRDSAVRLWPYAADDDPILATAAKGALSAIGAPAFTVPNVPASQRVEVAADVHDPSGDAVLREALKQPAVRQAAAEVSDTRPALVPTLTEALSAAREDGDAASAIVKALASTNQGRKALSGFHDDPALQGFILRVER